MRENGWLLIIQNGEANVSLITAFSDGVNSTRGLWRENCAEQISSYIREKYSIEKQGTIQKGKYKYPDTCGIATTTKRENNTFFGENPYEFCFSQAFTHLVHKEILLL